MRSPLAAIFLIVVVDVLAFTLIIPLLPFYAERFGATPVQVGLLVSAFALCQLVAGPFLGSLSDRIGRKPVLVASQLGTFVGFVVLALANSLWMVFAARILDGLTAGNLSVAQAAIADVTTPDKRARGFALIGVAFGLGFLVGPALSGWLATYDVRLPIAVAAGLSLTSVVMSLLLLPAPVKREAPQEGSLRGERAPGPPTAERRLGVLEWKVYADYFARPALAPRLLQFLFFMLSFMLFTSGFALFAERRFVTAAGRAFGPREVGLVLAYTGLLGVVLQGGVVSRVIARFGEAATARAGFVFLGAGFAMLVWARDVPMLLAAATVSALGSSPLRPALTSLVSRAVGPHEQGAVLGLLQSMSSVAQVTAPLLAGVLVGRMWLGAWALSAAAFAFAGLLVSAPEATETASAG